jgi:hypothetical protein
MARKRVSTPPPQRFLVLPHRGPGPLPVGEQLATLQRYLYHTGFLQLHNRPHMPGASPSGKLPKVALGDSAKETSKALKHFQRAQALPETGALDDDTVLQMGFPRCGVPNRQVKGVLADSAGVKWDKTDLSYSFSEYSRKLTAKEQDAAFEEAFHLWEQVTPLHFKQVTSQGDIQIRFIGMDESDYYTAGDLPGASFDGPGNFLAWTMFPVDGRSHFDDAESWALVENASAGLSQGVDVISVAAHEIGHALGLNHSPDRSALMFMTYFGPHRFLADDDVGKIQNLYGKQG